MEQEISDIYTEAKSDITKKWNEYMERSNSKLDSLQKAYDDAKALGDKDLIKKTGKELGQAQREQTLENARFQDIINDTTIRLAHTNEIALSYINDQLPDIYAKNYSQVDDTLDEIGIGFMGNDGIGIRQLVSEDTVKRLIKDGDITLPRKQLNTSKDQRWNTKQIRSSVLQGILQGESIPKIADRLYPIMDRNRSAAMRNARTLVTGAENRGRQDSYKRLADEGVIQHKVWIATPDGRTRDWHIEMDGQEVEIDEMFDDGIDGLMYPGDSGGAPESVYNCRCSMYDKIIGFRRADGTISYVDDFLDEEDILHEDQIEAERERRAEEKVTGSAHIIAQGEDISETWERRPDQFAFEIEDVINAQGFDGLPRVVNAEEFDRYVQMANDGNGFIAQRTYSAPDQETLDMYRQQLYDGKWYVDCSTGGAAYGQGMYSVYSNDTTVTEYMEREMAGYGARRGIEHNYVETFTLTPDAKTITPNEIIDLRKSAHDNLMAEFESRGGWKNPEALKWASEHDATHMDDGTFAALMGYDAILTSGINNYAVILNRTKVIFKGE